MPRYGWSAKRLLKIGKNGSSFRPGTRLKDIHCEVDTARLGFGRGKECRSGLEVSKDVTKVDESDATIGGKDTSCWIADVGVGELIHDWA